MARPRPEIVALEDDPLWYKDAVIYEVHVRAFCDSNGDGIGDFKGLASKLDYLQELGVTALWLLPFYPSPLRDDGYDIADYFKVNPIYGTLADFKKFLDEAHRRGMRVITELVLNHTSDRNPWFQRARKSPPGSRWRNYYVWSDTQERYREARIIFTDTEKSNWTWDPVAKSYFWHRFFSHQPDLNYDNPEVVEASFKVMDFWLEMGVDGLRLDAVPYLYEREGTNCENLPETHEYLKKLRARMDAKFKNRMFLSEANQWPEDTVPYFGKGDECHVNFHFPLMPRMFMAVRLEVRTPILDILDQTPAIPEKCQWATFLRNHDELTLEMVTDEERDYMYRVYAPDPRMKINVGIRRRLAPLLDNDRRTIELMNGLLFSLAGTPALYYGDEIGMGDNIHLDDRNGVRTPMQWNAGRNAGFSKANSRKLYFPVIDTPEFNPQVVNVETQQASPNSLFQWMKRIIALRKRYKAFGRGSLTFLNPENPRILAYLRRHEKECILAVANLSRHVQSVELDLAGFEGRIPVEISGQTRFPAVSARPYSLTLGPHAFYWFSLEPASGESGRAKADALPVLAVNGNAESVFAQEMRERLADALARHLPRCRWFRSKARRIKAASISGELIVSKGRMLLVRVEFFEGEPETYVMPVLLAPEAKSELLGRSLSRQAAILQVQAKGHVHLLFDALWDADFAGALLKTIGGRKRIKAGRNELVGWRSEEYPRLAKYAGAPTVFNGEQSNTSVVYGTGLILKLIRRIESGIDPDVEIKRYLSERTGFKQIAPVAGALELRRAGQPAAALASLEGYVANAGDAWSTTQTALAAFISAVSARTDPAPQRVGRSILDRLGEAPPSVILELAGRYLSRMELLGKRTAQLHAALASDPKSPAFAPEPYNGFHQRSIYQTARSLAGRVFADLKRSMKGFGAKEAAIAASALPLEAAVLRRLRGLLDNKIEATRTRVHGDFHLGQVLDTGRDFVIIDFEGEPARPIGERRIKKSPLVDVAGMLRSFQYAAGAAGLGASAGDEASRLRTRSWAQTWADAVSAAFLNAYLNESAIGNFLPPRVEHQRLLLDSFMLEKAVYELGYEINNRPAWIQIPIAGITEILEAGG